MRMASAGSAPQHQAAAQRLVATNAIARLSQVCSMQDAVAPLLYGILPSVCGNYKGCPCTFYLPQGLFKLPT